MFAQERQALDRTQRRARPRADDRPQPGGAARRHGRGAQRRARQGQRVHRAAAGCAGTSADDASRPSTGPRVAPRSRRDSPRASVLVVDDNEDAADDARRNTSDRLGYRVRTAYDGPVGARRVRAGVPPDIALLDIGLPVMDGYELARPAARACRVTTTCSWSRSPATARSRSRAQPRRRVRRAPGEAGRHGRARRSCCRLLSPS